MAEAPATSDAVQRAQSRAPGVTHAQRYEPRKAWAITIWLTALAAINFLDKVVLGMVAVPIMRELHLSPTQFGVIAGSFFWLFSLSAAVVGFVGNRVPARWLLLGMAAFWSVIQFPVSLASGATSLVVLRVLLGIGEAPGYPVSVHALYKWFPHEKRNLPVSIINQGAVIGLLLAGLGVPFITRDWGWRANFVVLAVASALWGIGWLCFGREGTLTTQLPHHAHTNANANAPVRIPYLRLLRDPTIWTGFLAGFAAYWGIALLMTWLPSYLERGLGYDAIGAGRMFSFVVAIGMPINVGLCGWSQRMLRRGASSRAARAVFAAACVGIGGMLFIALPALPLTPLEKVALIAVAVSLPQTAFTLGPAIVGEIVPDAQRSAVVAMTVAVATSAGMIAPVVMGRLLQAHAHIGPQGFEQGFAICGGVMIVGALAVLIGQHPARALKRLYGQT
ncbi:MFS transporter [Burkholderia guangdongensis]|uniref:MFS transporter n=1 Tax=Burkholderia guangdongensis TaxID=1792500 RepID=UPI0015CE3CD0|nr:MFS transporter [Burkholderia guangdongensis]